MRSSIVPPVSSSVLYKRKQNPTKKIYISQMPICLMARTFMTRHFLNGLFRLALFCLLFFSVGKWWTKGTTFWKQKKKEEKFSLAWCFLMTLLTVFFAHLERWPLTFCYARFTHDRRESRYSLSKLSRSCRTSFVSLFKFLVVVFF